MTQRPDDDIAPTATGSDEGDTPGAGTTPRADPDPGTFTLAGPGSDPATPGELPTGGNGAEPDAAPSTSAAAGASNAGTSTAGVITGPAVTPSANYDKYGVPTLDFVRDKIEARYAASLGAEELARQTEEAKSFEQRAEERAKAAEAALEEIRRSLRAHRQS